MKPFHYIFALLLLLTATTAPVCAKHHGCDKCDAKGTFRCAPKSSKHIEACGDNLCWGPSGKDCGPDTHCIEGESVYCKNTAEACKGCKEFFKQCVTDYWNECDLTCEMICERNTCFAFDGRCKNECLMKGCQKWN
ncbi:hypothetical protein T440DRAFT_391766 [Plenodomus tracheiphilus IPT5]|uniref:Uncharacterized protein n=1 Tax=Plenodomus tracheiphilus IPT5 TaxID=1408161 RepID=A0A6A7BFC6_9PLEO|nr:hypothetical protein T440DRAFT_391766 [Plenodomus tracheiphilus IPT5]